MKLKESKGKSLVIFTIILAVLVVVAGGVIVYLLNGNIDNDQNEVNINNEEDSEYLELLRVSLDRYIYYLRFLAKFDDISKADLGSVVEYSLFDADFAYFDDKDGWKWKSDDWNDIISEVAKRFDVSNEDIKNRIKNVDVDPQWAARYGQHDYSGEGFPTVTYSKIQDIKYLGNNKYEVKAIQFDIVRGSDGMRKSCNN